MKPQIHGFHSPDADLDTFKPSDPTDVGVLVQIMIGPEGGLGYESFDVVVCTPGWFQEDVRREGIILGRHYLFVERFHWEFVRRFLEEWVGKQHGDSWEQLALRLSRLGKWEFEDYEASTEMAMDDASHEP